MNFQNVSNADCLLITRIIQSILWPSGRFKIHYLTLQTIRSCSNFLALCQRSKQEIIQILFLPSLHRLHVNPILIYAADSNRQTDEDLTDLMQKKPSHHLTFNNLLRRCNYTHVENLIILIMWRAKAHRVNRSTRPINTSDFRVETNLPIILIPRRRTILNGAAQSCVINHFSV